MKTNTGLGALMVAALAVSGLAACGGGGNGGPPSSTVLSPDLSAVSPGPPPPLQLPLAPPSASPAPTSPSPYWLASGAVGLALENEIATAAGTSKIDSGHLVVVDPASPMTPAALEAPGQWHLLAQFDEGTTDSIAGAVSDLHTRFFVYLKDSRVRRLDLRRATWPPASVPVSSLTTSQICGISAKAFRDTQAAERSWLVFADPGPDRACNTMDDRQLAVRLDMTETDPPVIISSEVGGTLRSTTGAIMGFVIRSGTQVRKVDARFTNPVDLFTLAGGNVSFVVTDKNEMPAVPHRQVLFIEGNQLRAYNLESGSMPVTLLTLNQGECCASIPVSDANHVFLRIHGTEVGGRLIRIGDANSVEELANEMTDRIGNVLATPTRLVYASIGASTMVYRSVPKTGGAPVAISPAIACIDYATVFVSAEDVWYDCGPGNYWDYALMRMAREYENVARVWIVRSDGTQSQKFDNAWIVTASHANPMPTLPNGSTIYAITVAHFLPATYSTTMRVYEGATRAELHAYGTVTLGSRTHPLDLVEPFQWTRPALVTAGTVWERDIYYVKSDAAGLTRVTSFVP